MANFENDFEDPTPLTKGEFRRFLSNDFAHVTKAIYYIKGQMKVLVPLIMALVAGIVTAVALAAI